MILKWCNWLALVTLLAITPTQALASVKGFDSSNTNLGTFTELLCSTGMTCTNVGGQFKMVCGTTLTNGETITNGTDDTVTIGSDDEAIVLRLEGFEAKAATLDICADQCDDTADKFALSVSTADLFTFKNGTTTLYSVSSAGVVTGIGQALSGFTKNQVAATATTITVAQCGSTFINSGAVQMELPEASAALGCRLTFITGNASNFDLNPDTGDQILVLTNAAGDAIRNATLGNTVVLEAFSASQWAEISAVGTWSDIN